MAPTMLNVPDPAPADHAIAAAQERVWLHYVLAVVLVAVLSLICVCLPGDDPRLRFASLHAPSVVKLNWIYPRLHDDPTPVDVAFIGTSRTVYAVDSARIEADLHQAGRDLHIVNIGLQHPGRNMHYLLARELLQTRKPKLLVLEIDEDEPRDLHPAYAEVATVWDIITAPVFINISYFSDLARLPRRQLTLAAQTLFGGAHGFDPADYRGPHWDDTRTEDGTLRDPIHGAPRLHHPNPEELEAERRHGQALLAGKLSLPGPLSWLERRANLLYLENIIALARARGVPVALLYLHAWHSHVPPTQLAEYAGFGPIWQLPERLDDPELWLDVNHFNYSGSQAMAAWLAQQIAADARVK